MNHNFLHNHLMSEKNLGLDENHVIIDRIDWLKARELLRNTELLKPKENNPFTDDEQIIMIKLLDAHTTFNKLDRYHPDEMKDWVNAIHTLQRILMCRVTTRDYPNHFKNINKSEF